MTMIWRNSFMELQRVSSGWGRPLSGYRRMRPCRKTCPPSLAETIPGLIGVIKGKSAAVICSGFTCLPPIFDPERLRKTLAGAGKNDHETAD